MESPANRGYDLVVKSLWNTLVTLFGVLAGLAAGLIAGGVTAALMKLFTNRPLPPWGWRTNIAVETIAMAIVCLAICRWRRTEPCVQSIVMLVAGLMIGLAFIGDGPVVVTLLNLNYFLPPCVAAVAGAIGSMRFIRRKTRNQTARAVPLKI